MDTEIAFPDTCLHAGWPREAVMEFIKQLGEKRPPSPPPSYFIYYQKSLAS